MPDVRFVFRAEPAQPPLSRRRAPGRGRRIAGAQGKSGRCTIACSRRRSDSRAPCRSRRRATSASTRRRFERDSDGGTFRPAVRDQAVPRLAQPRHLDADVLRQRRPFRRRARRPGGRGRAAPGGATSRLHAVFREARVRSTDAPAATVHTSARTELVCLFPGGRGRRRCRARSARSAAGGAGRMHGDDRASGRAQKHGLPSSGSTCA